MPPCPQFSGSPLHYPAAESYLTTRKPALLAAYFAQAANDVGSNQYVLSGLPTPHSPRSESTGSSLAARIAGMLLASIAAPISAKHTAA
jgi:hypothetical protein